uniref:DUF4389 domain-containing protein n=1 Tax=Cellvibrio fontiphilus TaxID=1815559 RepID=UPI002B4BAC0D|nr:DUF4389 domain-containing protein [Cellvibrio fontiphilus]
MDNDQLKSNLTSSKHWFRLIFMLLFAAILQLASIVMWALVIIQFCFSLITGEDNQHLRRFGYSLSTYIYEVLKFLSYSSEEKPFPFADWPMAKDSVATSDKTEIAAHVVIQKDNDDVADNK